MRVSSPQALVTKSIKIMLIYAAVVAVSVWRVFPVYWMLKSAVSGGSVVNSFRSFFPRNITGSFFLRLFSDYPFFRWLLNSAVVSGCSTITAIFIGALAGYSLSRFQYRGKSVLGALLLFTQLLPHVILLLPIYILFDALGLINRLFSLIFINVFFLTPVCTWLLKGFFDSSPPEIEEAALLDGCSRLRIIITITMRINLAGIFATSLFVFLDSWYEWLYAATLIDQPEKWTVSASIYVFIGELGIDWQLMMAAGVLATVPTILIFAILQRSLMKGIRLGMY